MTGNLLYGRIDITDNLPFVLDVVTNNPSTVVINLDEDNQQLKSSKNVLGGAELLPPFEAIAAEIDGDEQLYDYIYTMHFNDPFVIQYVTGIIAVLAQGRSILMYYPTLDPSETKTVPKLIDQFWKNYGIGIGLLGYNDGVYDYSKAPLWLRLLYMSRIIGYKEFLIRYPLGNPIDGPIMECLLADIKPFGEGFQENINFVLKYWEHIQRNPKIKIPFHSM